LFTIDINPQHILLRLIITASVLTGGGYEFFGPLYAKTYFVNKSGSDANSCATAQSATDADAKLTVSAGILCLSAADLLLIGDGTYTETITGSDIPNGTGAGTETIIRCESDRGGGKNSALCIFRLQATLILPNTASRIIFDSVAFDGQDFGNTTFRGANTEANEGVDNISFDDIECLNGGGSACLAFREGATGGTFENSYYHDSNSHCLYLRISNAIIQDNVMVNCGNVTGSFGIQIYAPTVGATGNVIRRNRIEDSGNASTSRGGGIVLATGADNNQVYNNWVDLAGRSGIYVDGDGNEIYNNTLHDSGSYGIETRSSADSNTIRNNIAYLAFAELHDVGTNNTYSNNLIIDPLFTDRANNDFTLTANSPARDAGFELSSVFSRDYPGTTRPQGTAFDIGAYELHAPSRPSAPTNLRIVP